MKQKKQNSINYILLFLFIFLPGVFCRLTVHAAAQEEDSWFLNDINAQSGWTSLAESQSDFSSPVIVAVIDTGCDYSHPLFANSLWINSAEQNGIPGVDDDGNGYIDDIYGIDTCNQGSDPMDDSVSTIKGHGTHVAGCILQTAGVTETANPFQIRLMPIKAGDAYGNFHARDVAEAIRYAADNGASVINLSISSLTNPPVLQEALEYASRSAVIVASAGNQGVPTSDSKYTSCGNYYPAACPYVAGVMSYGKNRRLSNFSNWDFSAGYGPEYEIAAPGEEILSCTYNGLKKTMSGTSMAAGIVSGCAALLAAKYAPLQLYDAKDLTAHLMSAGENEIAYTDLYGKNHSFRRIDLQKLLSEPPAPNLALENYSVIKNSSDPDTYELNYTISNKGCSARNISVGISADSPEVILDTVSNPADTLSALSDTAGSFRISLPDGSQTASIQITLQISCENGADVSDTKRFSCEKTLSITTENPPSCSETEIPLQGITVSASPQLVMQAGTSLHLTVSYLPQNTTDDKNLTFLSSQPLIADVDENGVIWAKQNGTAKITVISSKQHTRQITVIVYDKTNLTPDIPDESDSLLTVPEKPAVEEQPSSVIKKGSVYTIGNLKYKVTNASMDGSGTVSLIGTAKKKASLSSLTVKNTVRIQNARFRVTAIGKSAFTKCKNLKSVKISNSVQTIGAACFSKCTSLKKLTIGKGVVKISSRAFDGCRNLKNIIVKPKKIAKIAKNAFRGIHPKAKFHASNTFLTQLSKYQ